MVGDHWPKEKESYHLLMFYRVTFVCLIDYLLMLSKPLKVCFAKASEHKDYFLIIESISLHTPMVMILSLECF